MTSKTVFVLDPEMGWNRWDLTIRPIDFNESVVKEISAGVVRQLKNVMPASVLGDGFLGGISLSLGNANASAVFSVPIFKMPLTAPYAEPVNGILHPNFTATGPIFPMVWEVPDSMKLVLAISIGRDSVTQFLVAYNNGATYRLPVSNLYDDCKLCSGNYEIRIQPNLTRIDAVKAAWTQFHKSPWNHDLFRGAPASRVTGARRMFGFKPLKEGFEQVPVPEDWPKYCEKVGNSFLADYVILHD